MLHVLSKYKNVIKGLVLGLIVGAVISLLCYHPAPQVIEKKVPVIIEKPVGVKIVKVPVHLTQTDKQEIKCLADAAYFEAGNQPNTGIAAVSSVVVNRTHSRKFPKHICSVVHQKWNGECQFTWACGEPKVAYPSLYRKSYQIAQNVYLANIEDNTKGALYFHAKYVHPHWNLRRTVAIGAHIFYR